MQIYANADPKNNFLYRNIISDTTVSIKLLANYCASKSRRKKIGHLLLRTPIVQYINSTYLMISEQNLKIVCRSSIFKGIVQQELTGV
jgi:hypothetical protein